MEAVLEQMPSGVLIAEAPSGRLLLFNGEGARILRHSMPPVNATGDYAQFRGQHADGRPYAPDDYPLVRALTRGETIRHEDLIYLRGDGSTALLSVNASPIRNVEGHIVAAVATFHDITERRRERDALRRQSQLINLSHDAVITATPDRVITGWNAGAQETYGWTAAEATGRVIHHFLHTRGPLATAEIDGVLQREARWDGELAHVRKDGAEITVESSQALMRDEQGRPAAILEINRDVTGRKRAEEVHYNAQKLESIGLLAGGIAHDYNNLLTGILGNASLILPGADLETCERVEAIMKGAQKAADLTRQLLAYAGKARFVVRELDLPALVRGMADLIRVSVPRHIEFRYDLRPARVRADEGNMQQVVMSLATNAAEAIGEGQDGVVAIATGVETLDSPPAAALGETLPPGSYAYLEVSDNGCGMDEATRARIFDPFFTTKFLGRGLGLAAVAGIVRSHHGAIRITTTPGQGSTFRVLCPAVQAPAGEPRRGVLVVDDEDSVRDILQRVLESRGFSVACARDGREALALLDESGGAVALVVLDVVMPGMGGSEALEAIRTRHPGVKVLLTSGYSEEEVHRLCRGAGRAAFIQKPYTAQQLGAKIRGVLES